MKLGLSQQAVKKIKTIFISGVIIILLYFFLTNLNVLSSLIRNGFGLLTPFIIGFAIAFVLKPLSEWIEIKVLGKLKWKASVKRFIAVFVAILLGVLAFIAVLMLGIPGLIASVQDFAGHFNTYVDSITDLINNVSERYHFSEEIQTTLTSVIDEIIKYLSSFLTNNLPNIINVSMNVINSLMNMMIGVIIAVYLLSDRERFMRQAKRVNYAVFNKRIADYLCRVVAMCSKTFYAFIVSKAVESVILAFTSYVVMYLFGIEYASIICVIIGITNLIPIFGPYLGALPSAFILVMVNPSHAITFLIIIIVLQQLIHHFISPQLMKDTLGIPSFWILFSIVIGGGLFGILGMFLAVPLFAVVYTLISHHINGELQDKEGVLDEIYKD